MVGVAGDCWERWKETAIGIDGFGHGRMTGRVLRLWDGSNTTIFHFSVFFCFSVTLAGLKVGVWNGTSSRYMYLSVCLHIVPKTVSSHRNYAHGINTDDSSLKIWHVESESQRAMRVNAEEFARGSSPRLR